MFVNETILMYLTYIETWLDIGLYDVIQLNNEFWKIFKNRLFLSVAVFLLVTLSANSAVRQYQWLSHADRFWISFYDPI